MIHSISVASGELQIAPGFVYWRDLKSSGLHEVFRFLGFPSQDKVYKALQAFITVFRARPIGVVVRSHRLELAFLVGSTHCTLRTVVHDRLLTISVGNQPVTVNLDDQEKFVSDVLKASIADLPAEDRYTKLYGSGPL